MEHSSLKNSTWLCVQNHYLGLQITLYATQTILDLPRLGTVAPINPDVVTQQAVLSSSTFSLFSS